MTSVLAVRQKAWMVFFIGTGDGQLIKASLKPSISNGAGRGGGGAFCHLIEHCAGPRHMQVSHFNLEPKYDCDEFKCSKLTFYLELL